jgi:hypothetical protein
VLFLGEHRDWVAWTPAGFFVGTGLGKSMLGIHGVAGDGSAALVRLSAFAEIMRRPDIVRGALEPWPAPARAR